VATPPVILVVNPGSTSTKLAIAHGEAITACEALRHSADDLRRFSRLWDQFDTRLQLAREWACERLSECSAVVGIGGLLRPLSAGTYRVNNQMLADARANLQGEHASNLGCALAHALAAQFHCPAFTVDPVSVNEFEPLAAYSGHPAIVRNSLSHALNIHAAARRAAQAAGIPYHHSSFIVAHLGGGISIAPVRDGRIIDVNDAASDGPFSPERTGGLPLQPFITLCFSGRYTEQELRRLVMGSGGLVAYLGTNSLPEAERRIASGDEKARDVVQGMAYQIAKEIGAMATVLACRLDGIVLTGGMAHSNLLTSMIAERVNELGPVTIAPGEDEMKALAEGALRVLRDEEQEKEY
jgi:butyrate kinase